MVETEVIRSLPDIVNADDEEFLVLVQCVDEFDEVLGLPFEFFVAALNNHDAWWEWKGVAIGAVKGVMTGAAIRMILEDDK